MYEKIIINNKKYLWDEKKMLVYGCEIKVSLNDSNYFLKSLFATKFIDM